ncbi:BMP family protein [Propylenella binzhouense]|uniref:BMP family ABC transporter substrate-binding protein n=1 Tax=Propylenella binzhouense TaxID=2555902 RepID=A0A964T254_9HYPH|nr:BMP family protein [Propylenella binzhouense]MYZ47081.1 BMP family ABC transporter substrate-binding protein [Propylenella binzhouense]
MFDSWQEGRRVVGAALSRRNVLGAAVALVAGAAALAPAAAQDKLKVAAIFSTPIEEPWVNQVHEALLKAHEELGVEYKWAESVPSSDYARVLREFARDGYGMISGDAFAAEDITRRVAREFKDVAFVMGSGQGPAEPNFAVFDNWIHEPAYLSGMIAGKMTKSNILGSVAAMDIPEVARLVNAFCAGAKEVNPAVKCKVSFIGSFFDPPKAKEAALAQIAAGVDVIYAERFGVIEAAQEKGILAISNMSDQAALAPDTVVTGPVWDMWPTIQAAVRQVQAGVFTAQDFGTFSTMTKGGASLAPFHAFEEKLPPDVIKMVKDREAAILAGDFRVPVNESTPVSE